jgi:hypothetical protein
MIKGPSIIHPSGDELFFDSILPVVVSAMLSNSSDVIGVNTTADTACKIAEVLTERRRESVAKIRKRAQDGWQ